LERYEILNTVLKPADLLVGAQLELLRRAGLYGKLQDNAYWAIAKLWRSNFERSNALEVEGLDKLPQGPLVLASNHQSWYDAQVLTASFPRRIHFMAKSEFRTWPLMRHMIDISKAFYVDRKGGKGSGLDNVMGLLADGSVVALYPEGTIPGEEDIPRSAVEPHTALLRGHTGMVRLAITGRAPIIPVGVSGTSSAFPPEMFPRLEVPPVPRNEPISVRFGDPISFESYGGELPDRAELRERTNEVMSAISELVDHHRQFVPLARLTPEIAACKPKQRKHVGILLLHGFTSSTKCVDGLLPLFEEHGFPVRRPVLRGHGTVYTALKGVTAKDWIADAQSGLEELLRECDQALIVGLSMGGLVALELARRNPDKVAGVVTLAAALRFADPLAGLSEVLAKVVPYWPSPNAYRDAELAKTNNENYPRFATDAFASLYRLAGEVEERLGDVKAPLLVVHSRRDQVVHPKAAEVIHAKAGSTEKELVWFNRSGHEMLLDLEADDVAPLVIEFVLRRRSELLAATAEEPAEQEA